MDNGSNNTTGDFSLASGTGSGEGRGVGKGNFGAENIGGVSKASRAGSQLSEANKVVAWDQKHVWHGFTQMAEYEPLLIERGEGNWLIDMQGRRYLDGVSSMWCNVHGHRHPIIDAAIVRQLEQIAQVTSLGMGSPTTARLAAELVRVTPQGLEHVFFSSDGACAIEAALKLAIQYWHQCPEPQPNKRRFVALGSAYHGDTVGTVSLGGVERFRKLFSPLLFDALRGPLPDTYRLPEGVSIAEATSFYLDKLEEVLRDHHATTAAVVIEPLVQGAAGMVMHPGGFLAGVRALTSRYNCLLICDEVATGFGRTGRMFACEHEGVAPDILCLGKGLTGGYLPMAATMTTRAIWEAFLGPEEAGLQFFHGHTYSGNPICAAAALASLEVFASQQVIAKLPDKIARLTNAIAGLREIKQVGDVRQCGMMVGIELVADRVTKRPFPRAEQRAHSICRRCTDAGVWLRPLGDVIVLMPPLSIQDDEIELMGKVVGDAINGEFEE